VENHAGHHDILGQSQISAEKMVAFVKSINPTAQDIDEIAIQFIEIGKRYNLKGDIAFCQSIIETGWFKFDGGTAVTPGQHNYCGMGVTSKGIKGNEFPSVIQGVMAQIQHLFAYACNNPLPIGEVIIDQRYQYVTRGISPHWEDLNNHWAMNDTYGQQILAMYDKLVAFEYVPPVEEQPTQETPIEEKPIENVPDVPEIIVTPEQPVDDTEKQYNFWIRIINYIFDLVKQLFGKKN
jgi:hypothetical protein